jgi:hypothetical protein
MKQTTPFIAGVLAVVAVSGFGGPSVHAQPAGAPQAAPPAASKPAVYRRQSNTWFLRNTPTTGIADTSFVYGLPSDRQLMGDWDGDGVKTPGVYRSGKFFLRNSNTTGVADISFFYGIAGGDDVPLVGDWDGDGVDTVGVYRADAGNWYLRNTNTSGVADLSFTYGRAFELVDVGDWDGNGTDTPVVKRTGQVVPGITSEGAAFQRNSNTTGAADAVIELPISESVPIVADFDGNGIDEFALISDFSCVWTTLAGDFCFGDTADRALVWR